MALISIYRDIKPLDEKQVYIQQQPLVLPQIIEVIRAGGIDDYHIADYRDKINTIRKQPKAETQRLKASLHSFTVAALFKDKKGTQQPHIYTNMMVLDIDGLTCDEALDAKKRLIGWGFCLAVFISPSGKGVKAVVQFENITNKQHSTVFGAMRLFIQEKFNLPLDPSGSDFSRLCYFSHDADAYCKVDDVPCIDANELLAKYKDQLLTTPGHEYGVVIDESTVDTTTANSIYDTFVTQLVAAGDDSSEGKRNSFLLALTRLKAYNLVASDVMPLAIKWIKNSGLRNQYTEKEIREKITYNFANYYRHYETRLIPSVTPVVPPAIGTAESTVGVQKIGYLSDYLDLIHTKLLTEKALYIDAPTGMGKTTMVRLLAKKMGCKVDLLMPTRALVEQQATGKKLADQGTIAIVVGSKQLDSKHIEADVLAACYPAIRKLRTRNARVLVIDEVHSLVSDYGYKSDVIQTLSNYLSRYDYVIGLSGSMFPLAGMLTKSNYLKFRNPNQLQYEYKLMTLAKKYTEADGTVVKAIRERDYFINNINPDALNVLYLNDKRELKKLQKTLQTKGLRVLLFTKDEVDANDYDFKNAYIKLIDEQQLVDCDVLLTTCLLQAGVNINNKYNGFDNELLGNKKGIEITFAKSSNLVDIIQFTARFRRCAPSVTILHDQQVGKKRGYNATNMRKAIDLRIQAYRAVDKQYTSLIENEVQRQRINHAHNGVMMDCNKDYKIDEYFLLFGQLQTVLYNVQANVTELRNVLETYHFVPAVDECWIGEMNATDSASYGMIGKQLQEEKKAKVGAVVAQLLDNTSMKIADSDTLRKGLQARMKALLKYASKETIAAERLMTDTNYKQFKRRIAFLLIEHDKTNQIQLPADVRLENENFNKLKASLEIGVKYTADELKAAVALVPELRYSEGKYLTALKVMYHVKALYEIVDEKKTRVGYELSEITWWNHITTTPVVASIGIGADWFFKD